MLESTHPPILNRPPIHVQDGLFGNSCFGCGAWNRYGLNIKSKWIDDLSICEFTPAPHHAAMPHDIVNGGIIAAVIDCHCVCTAISHDYRRAGRYPGDGDRPLFWHATTSLKVNYRKPTPISGPFTVEARVIGVRGRRTTLKAELKSHEGEVTCDGEVVSARVSDEWADPKGLFAN